MANAPSYEAPSKKAKAEGGKKTIVVEKIPENWGLGDPVDTFKEQGYEVVSDGPRRVTMQMPAEKFQEMEAKVKDEAERRLKSTDGLGKVKQTERSASEIKDSLPDVGDLDG